MRLKNHEVWVVRHDDVELDVLRSVTAYDDYFLTERDAYLFLQQVLEGRIVSGTAIIDGAVRRLNDIRCKI